MNVMKTIKIDKLTLNIGAGKDAALLKKGRMLLKNLTGIEPVNTITQKRLAAWGLRPGLPIGCKITLRNESARDLVPNLLAAKDNIVKESWFDNFGNFSFGIHEYVDIPGLKYDTEIGIIGLQVSITLSRPGFRIKSKKLMKGKIGKNHLIRKEEAINFFKENYNIKLGDDKE